MEISMNEKICAIVLAAGKGRRMGGDIQKQYMKINGKPLIYYSLKTMEKVVDEIVLVVGQGEIPYCQEQIVDLYKFKKISKIVEGGKERYNSVYAGLQALKKCDYVLIHDGARPCITKDILEKSIEFTKKYKATVLGTRSKDTIKISDKQGIAIQTPDRNYVWNIQTPQSFEYNLIRKAYDTMLQKDTSDINITDDAMVVEMFTEHKIKIVEGSYTNIKVTTPEDIELVKVYIKDIFMK